MDKISLFKNFINQYKNENPALVEAINKGFSACFEASTSFTYGTTPREVFDVQFDVMLGEDGDYRFDPGNSTMDNDILGKQLIWKDGLSAQDSPRGGYLFDKDNLWLLLTNLFDCSGQLTFDNEDEALTPEEQDACLDIRTSILQTLGIEEI